MRSFLPARLQFRPQGSLAATGQCQQVVVVESQQRPFKHHRQGKVILWQEQERTQGHQVHHRHLFGEYHAVGTGHGHLVIFEATHQFVHEGSTATHQNQNIPGTDGPPLGFQNFPVFDPAGNTRSDARGENGFGAGAGDSVQRRVPGLTFLGLLRRNRRPQLHASGLAPAEGKVARLPARGRQSGVCFRPSEDPVHGGQ